MMPAALCARILHTAHTCCGNTIHAFIFLPAEGLAAGGAGAAHWGAHFLLPTCCCNRHLRCCHMQKDSVLEELERLTESLVAQARASHDPAFDLRCALRRGLLGWRVAVHGVLVSRRKWHLHSRAGATLHPVRLAKHIPSLPACLRAACA